MEKIILENQNYKLYENYKDGFDLEELTNKMTDYFLPYDYIVGDWAYGKMRLKGFYKKDHKNCKKVNDFTNYKDYIKNNCAYDCRYFVVEKVIE